jgi:NAD(P)-dependent dehydrogenase (short-subunit alcohol dehydrogenase family)
MIMPTLTGKTALVTGASRGMGRASALAIAAAGAQVLVHYGRGANEADGVVAEIRKAGGRADAIATDLGRRLWPCPQRLAAGAHLYKYNSGTGNWDGYTRLLNRTARFSWPRPDEAGPSGGQVEIGACSPPRTGIASVRPTV